MLNGPGVNSNLSCGPDREGSKVVGKLLYLGLSTGGGAERTAETVRERTGVAVAERLSWTHRQSRQGAAREQSEGCAGCEHRSSSVQPRCPPT